MPATNFSWEPLSDNILQERDEFGALTAEYTAEPGLYGNIISQNRSGVESQFHFDAVGSTLALTDGSEQLSDTRAYSAFGETTESTGSTSFDLNYVGQKQYFQCIPPIHYVRRRIYESRHARWYSFDPAGAGLAQFSSFAYSCNNPSLLIDPSGTITIKKVDEHLRGAKCGDKIFIRWDFELEANAPCDGYFVQEIAITCRKLMCFDETCCECPRGTAAEPDYHYYEAFFVKKGELTDRHDDKFRFTDESSSIVDDGKCGYQISRGTVKFFCKDGNTANPRQPVSTGDLGDIDRNPADRNSPWRINQFYGFGFDCKKSPGHIPSTGDRPPWWNGKSVERLAERFLTLTWCCCDDSFPNNYIRPRASPR